MILKSLQPDAFYDAKPAALYKDGDGSYLFRYNIEPYENEDIKGYQCREIRFFETPTHGILKRLVIRSVMDESDEFKLINNYNKNILGIRIDPAAEDKYREYLTFVDSVDEMIANANNNVLPKKVKLDINDNFGNYYEMTDEEAEDIKAMLSSNK